MSASSLEGKTIRPGSLGAYSYYHSNRRPVPARPPQPAYIAAKRRFLIPKKLVVTVLVLAAIIGLPLLRGGAPKQTGMSQSSQTQAQNQIPVPAAATVTTSSTDTCAGNSLDKLVVVSITQRHLWACEHSQSVYNSPVITGMTAHEETVTPTGSYHIYAKQSHTVLTGSDAAGSWRDPVDYWMPFLNNQFGTYGFHDATWRKDNEFGNVSPSSPDASHGCVELPLAASKWLYDWAQVGTAVIIKS